VRGSAGRLALSPTQAIDPPRAAIAPGAAIEYRPPRIVAIRAFVQSVSHGGVAIGSHYTRKPSASRHGTAIVIDHLDHLVLTTAHLDRCVDFYIRSVYLRDPDQNLIEISEVLPAR
jgi:hypothetical protein